MAVLFLVGQWCFAVGSFYPLLGENGLFIDELGGTLLDPPPILEEIEEAPFAAIGDTILEICSDFVQDLIDAAAFPTMEDVFKDEPKEPTQVDLIPLNTALCAILYFYICDRNDIWLTVFGSCSSVQNEKRV